MRRRDISTASRELAQFFTPQPVAAFALDALIALGLEAGPFRAVDPACGEGVFLAEARRRFPDAELWGYDLDETLAEHWQKVGLNGPRTHLAVQDGLLDAPLFGIGAGGFALVMGNPPYGLGMARPGAGEPIEALFVRRFVELARPGGWIAMVVPEGIVANSRCQRLRDWVAARAALKAVVALPESTFSRTGTRARTAVVLAQKGRGSAGGVLMASPEPPCEGKGGLRQYLAQVLGTIRSGASHVPSRRGRRAR